MSFWQQQILNDQQGQMLQNAATNQAQQIGWNRQPRTFSIPAKEPPEDVKQAFRVVMAWLREVQRAEEAERLERQRAAEKAQQEAWEAAKNRRDWRDEL